MAIISRHYTVLRGGDSRAYYMYIKQTRTDKSFQKETLLLKCDMNQ